MIVLLVLTVMLLECNCYRSPHSLWPPTLLPPTLLPSSRLFRLPSYEMNGLQQKAFTSLNPIKYINDTQNSGDSAATVWEIVRYEASRISESDMKAASIMTNSVLSHPSLEVAIIDYVANQLESPLFPATQVRNLFCEIIEKDRRIALSFALDLVASALNDDSQPTIVSVLLFNQGFHALITYRMANYLWNNGRDGLARYFQSLASRVFGSDIHPAAEIGHGCFISTGSGIVIGETARIGVDCSIFHCVTLGGTGKESGDRHPKVGNGVIINPGATVLGNIAVGDGAVIDAGAVVTKPVGEFSRVGGVPARFIAFTNGTSEEMLNEKDKNTTSLTN